MSDNAITDVHNILFSLRDVLMGFVGTIVLMFTPPLRLGDCIFAFEYDQLLTNYYLSLYSFTVQLIIANVQAKPIAY